MKKESLVKAFTEMREGSSHNAKSIPTKSKKILRLHQTDIATIENGKLYLATGGWYTLTTKSYLNLVLGACGINYVISQKDSKWYLGKTYGDIGTLFEDVVYIDLPTGKPVLRKTSKKTETDKLHAKITKYAKGFQQALIKGKIPMPSGGDCWGCCMKSKDSQEPMGIGHYIEHMEEKYYVPSLLVNACRNAKWSDFCIISLWQTKDFWMTKSVGKTIKRFLLLKLQTN